MFCFSPVPPVAAAERNRYLPESTNATNKSILKVALDHSKASGITNSLPIVTKKELNLLKS